MTGAVRPDASLAGLSVDDDAAASEGAWALTRLISPRRVVRAAAVGVDGRPINSYPLLHPLGGQVPLTPWAVPLADTGGRFRLLCADLDAAGAPAAAIRDARLLAGVLTDLGVPHVVCASGPSGGRHVWMALADGADAVLVAAFAQLLKAWLPALDTAPLLNPTSGCVRPPGTPHRCGGRSQVIAGDVTVLAHPVTTRADLERLVEWLARRVTQRPPDGARAARPTGHHEGMPCLLGVRRGLPPAVRALVDTVPLGDASATLWRILCAAASAHWRHADVVALRSAPGFEHARTLRAGSGRTARPPTGPASPDAVLRRQWTRAVLAVAASPTQRTGADPTFDTRAEAVAAVVRAVQGRADASADRWSDRRGIGQRRVLDALCLLQLQAVRVDGVEADIRRLALICGLDRETARRALLALAADGWIARIRPSAGPRGASWTIDPAGALDRGIRRALSQADPRPAEVGSALRQLHLDELADRLRAGAHDAFAPSGGLGAQAGALYGRLRAPLSTTDCGRLLAIGRDQTLSLCGRLAQAGLVIAGPDGWHRTDHVELDRVAAEQGTDGLGWRRAARYAVERALWAWWQAELVWMNARRGVVLPRRGLRPGQQVMCAGAAWPRHPRRPGGRADFAAAGRVLVRSGGHVLAA